MCNARTSPLLDPTWSPFDTLSQRIRTLPGLIHHTFILVSSYNDDDDQRPSNFPPPCIISGLTLSPKRRKARLTISLHLHSPIDQSRSSRHKLSIRARPHFSHANTTPTKQHRHHYCPSRSLRDGRRPQQQQRHLIIARLLHESTNFTQPLPLLRTAAAFTYLPTYQQTNKQATATNHACQHAQEVGLARRSGDPSAQACQSTFGHATFTASHCHRGRANVEKGEMVAWFNNTTPDVDESTGVDKHSCQARTTVTARRTHAAALTRSCLCAQNRHGRHQG